MHSLIEAIDDGSAVKVKAATFRDGNLEPEFLIEFYLWAGRLYRSSYNLRSTVTLYQEVDASEGRELFRLYYHE